MRIRQHKKTLVTIVLVVAIAVIAIPWNGFTLPVWWVEAHSGTVLWNGPTDAPIIALTFDDGPDPSYTPRILNILKHYGAHATFFVQGRMVRSYPALARQEIEQGHVIGNHTETHPYIERLSDTQIAAEIDHCDAALADALKIKTYLFRPPRGAWNPSIFRAVKGRGDRMVLWSASLEHADTPAPAQMAAQVLQRVQPGGIILMHDGANRNRETTVQALPLVLDGLIKQGYHFVTVSELLHVRGMERIN